MRDKTTKRDERYLQAIADLTAQGNSPEQVAIQFNLDISVIKEYIAHPEFVNFLPPEARDDWENYREAERARESLKAMARKNLHLYFEELDRLALDKNTRDDIRRDCLKELIRLSGASAEASMETEVVEMPPNQLAAIEKAVHAMDKQERSRPIPYGKSPRA